MGVIAGGVAFGVDSVFGTLSGVCATGSGFTLAASDRAESLFDFFVLSSSLTGDAFGTGFLMFDFRVVSVLIVTITGASSFGSNLISSMAFASPFGLQSGGGGEEGFEVAGELFFETTALLFHGKIEGTESALSTIFPLPLAVKFSLLKCREQTNEFFVILKLLSSLQAGKDNF